jgi:hypothetical protein
MNKYTFQTIIQSIIYSIGIGMILLLYTLQINKYKYELENIELRIDTIDKSKLSIQEINILNCIDEYIDDKRNNVSRYNNNVENLELCNKILNVIYIKNGDLL